MAVTGSTGKTIAGGGISGGTMNSSCSNLNALTSGNSGNGGGIIGQHCLKKSRSAQQPGDTSDGEESGKIIMGGCMDDTIFVSSDCELNEAKIHHRSIAGPFGSIISSQPQQNHIPINSNANNNILPGGNQVTSSGTLRSTGGIRTPSAGHTSPASSVSSSHLIFNHNGQNGSQKQSTTGSNDEAYYNQPDYYGWQSKSSATAKGPTIRDYQQQQQHEFFYWTQKHGHNHGRKKRNSASGSDSPGGSLHSRNTATSQQIVFYPSYKKTSSSKQQQQQPPSHHYSEAIDSAYNYHHHHQQQQMSRRAHQQYLQQQQHHLQQHQQQQQQLSSDEESCMESTAHAHLLQQINNRRGMHKDSFDIAQRNYYNSRQQQIKLSNCDLNQINSGNCQDYDHRSLGGGSDTYYNQSSLSGGPGSSTGGGGGGIGIPMDNGPVYEEILSNRTSGVQHYSLDYDVDEHTNQPPHLQYPSSQQQKQQQLHRSLNNYLDSCYSDADRERMGGNGSYSDDYADDDIHRNDANDDDNINEDDDADNSNQQRKRGRKPIVNLSLTPSADERMRRVMALQEEDFQRRFQ